MIHYVKNFIMLYGKEKMLPRVLSVQACENYSLIVTFKNGERKKYDAKNLLNLPMYKNLKKVFSLARVECGTVVWPGDMDISPDTLYLKGVKI